MVRLIISKTSSAQPTGPEPNLINILDANCVILSASLAAIACAALAVILASALLEYLAIRLPILGKTDVTMTSATNRTPTSMRMSLIISCL